MGFHQTFDELYSPWRDAGVGIEDEDTGGSCGLERLIDGARKSAIHAVADKIHPVPETAGRFNGPIHRRIVHYHNFRIGGFRYQRFDARPQPLSRIPVDDCDGAAHLALMANTSMISIGFTRNVNRERCCGCGSQGKYRESRFRINSTLAYFPRVTALSTCRP